MEDQSRQGRLHQYRQAALWRAKVLPLLQESLSGLREAYAACPISVERVQIGRAVKAAASAASECNSNLVLAERAVAELEADHAER